MRAPTGFGVWVRLWGICFQEFTQNMPPGIHLDAEFTTRNTLHKIKTPSKWHLEHAGHKTFCKDLWNMWNMPPRHLKTRNMRGKRQKIHLERSSYVSSNWRVETIRAAMRDTPLTAGRRQLQRLLQSNAKSHQLSKWQQRSTRRNSQEWAALAYLYFHKLFLMLRLERAFKHLFMSVYVCLCLSMSVYICLWVSMFVYECLGMSMSVFEQTLRWMTIGMQFPVQPIFFGICSDSNVIFGGL